MNQELDLNSSSKYEIDKKLFRNKKWIVILCLIIFWPLGLYLLFRSEAFEKNTKIIISCILFLVFFFAIKSDENIFQAKKSEPIELQYAITSDEHKGNIKRTVEVELPNRTDEKTLSAIAKKIFSMTSEQYERTFIAYRIAGDSNRGYWATTHFNPNLEIKILGSSDQAHNALMALPPPNGEVIGAWIVNWGGEYKMTAYMKNGAVFVQKDFADNSSSTEPFEMEGVDTLIKLQDERGKRDREYFLVNQDGNLEFWSESGNFYTAPKL